MLYAVGNPEQTGIVKFGFVITTCAVATLPTKRPRNKKKNVNKNFVGKVVLSMFFCGIGGKYFLGAMSLK